MTDDRPERPPTAAVVRALDVPRNAKIGLVSGTAFAALCYLVFVALAPTTVQAPVWYLSLAFVVALTTAAVVATSLTVRSAIKLSRELK